MRVARLHFADSRAHLDGFKPVVLTGIEFIDGPMPGMQAAVADEPTELRLSLTGPLGRTGTVMLWLRTDQPYPNGIGVENMTRSVVSADGLFELQLSRNEKSVTIAWRFNKDVYGVNPVLLSGLPGPQWIHLAYCWDAELGVFTGYLNGTPTRLPETRIKSWQIGTASELAVTVDRMAVADLQVFDAPVTDGELSEIIPATHRGALDAILGAEDRGMLDVGPYRGEMLYETSLATHSDIADWVMEGPGELTFEGGWMRMKSTEPDGHMGHFVHWCNEDFPADFLVEWEVQPLSDYGLCIVFISATGRDGQDIFDAKLKKRTGDFADYIMGDINCYHISYYANTPFNPGRITCNMRKNHGFYIVENGPPGIPPGSTQVHRVAVLKRGATVELAVDDRRIIRFTDDGRSYGPALGGGRIGLRQMQWMEARYRNVRVYALKGGQDR